MRRALPVLASALLGGCSFTPHYARPELPVPPSWPVGDAYLAQTEAKLPTITYRDVFKDVRLQAIVGQALVNNRDLRVSVANIAAARAQYRIQRADLFPEIDASGRYTYTHSGNGVSSTASSSTGSGGTTGTGITGTGTTGTGTTGTTGTGTTGIGTTGTGTTGTGSGSVISSSTSGSAFSVDLGTTAFELDLFGRVRSLTQASLARYFEQEAAARATRLTLVGEIGTAWLTYAADKSLLKIAQDTANSAGLSVRITRARLEGGIAPRTDLRQAEQVEAVAEADLASQRTALAQDANALQLLVGAPVDGSLLPNSIDEAVAGIAALPAGLDSTILLRRPDVVQAEYELRATNAEIGAARAALFPRISLTGIFGFASTGLSSLFTGGAFNYSVAPSVSYPIFRAGAGRAGVGYAKAERDVALATYEKAIQSAFRETADALARQGTVAAQLRANRKNLNAAVDTANLANAAYRGGVNTFLNSLDAQRSLYAAQQTLVATQLTGASNLVTLYQVIGGDSSLEADAKGPRPVSPSGAPRPEEPLPSANPAADKAKAEAATKRDRS